MAACDARREVNLRGCLHVRLHVAEIFVTWQMLARSTVFCALLDRALPILTIHRRVQKSDCDGDGEILMMS